MRLSSVNSNTFDDVMANIAKKYGLDKDPDLQNIKVGRMTQSTGLTSVFKPPVPKLMSLPNNIGSNINSTITTNKATKNTPSIKGKVGEIHPDFYKFINDLKTAVKKDKVLRKYLTDKDIKIKEGYRTKERQKQLYAIGRTKPGKVVTWTLDSRHNHGIAIDLAQPKVIADMVKHKKYGVESRFLNLAYKIADKYGIGGIPKRYKDPYHFQLDWKYSLY